MLDFVNPANEEEAAYGTKDGDGSAMGGVPRKDSGVEKRPTRRAREKLRVERVARNMPRRRREMHFARRRWWGERKVECEIKRASREGRRRLVRVKARSVGWRVWLVVERKMGISFRNHDCICYGRLTELLVWLNK